MGDRYKDVDYSPVDELSASPSPSPRTTRRTVLAFFGGVVLSLSLAAIGAAIFKPTILHIQQTIKSPVDEHGFIDEAWNHCGRSSKVAMENGCVMEPLYYGWFPPQCVYPELSQAYPVFEDRTYYSDYNMTIEIPKEDLYRGKHNRIFTPKYHDEHCLFGWRKLQYAYDHQVKFVDPKSTSMGHEQHCANGISAACEPGEQTNIEIGFYRCKRPFWADL